MIDDEVKQDALDWLERETHHDNGDDASAALQMLGEADRMEMTVLGMLLAHKPHDEIRHYMLTGKFEEDDS